MVRCWVEIQQWKMVSGGAVKERKGWESGEKKRDSEDRGGRLQPPFRAQE
jgi:hypothetical protein